MKAWPLIASVVTLWGLLAPASALVDTLNTGLQETQEPQLRWDNVESAPNWIAGPKPTYDLWQSRHLVTLNPGQSVTVRLPAHEMLRLQTEDRPLSRDEVEVRLSNGSGSFLETSMIPGDEGNALLVAPQAPYPQLAQIIKSSDGAPLRLGIYVSRHLKPRETFPYRDVVDLTGPDRPRVIVANRDRGEAEDFWPMRATEPVRTQLRGGTRYALETRFAYPLTESQLPQNHYISVKVNGEPWTELDYVTSAESSNVIYIDQKAHAIGRSERAFFDLPHSAEALEVEFVPMVPLIGRLLELESNGHLFPGLNATYALAAETPTKELWEMSDSQLQSIIQHGAVDALEAERAALRLARDNRRTNGALLATMLLRRQAAPRSDIPDLRRLASAIRGSHTFYRDVFPSKKTTQEPQEFAYFRPCRLKEIDRPQAWRQGAAQHTFAMVDRLPGAYFNDLPGNSEGLIYHIGERSSATEVRLIVSQEELNSTAPLAVSLDDGPWMSLQVDSRRRLPDSDFAPNQGELGLEMLRQRFPGHHHDTLDLPFSQTGSTGRLIRASYVEFPVDRKVKQIRVIADLGKGPHQKVRVALQVRAAKPFKLSETEYNGLTGLLNEAPLDLLVRCLKDSNWQPPRRTERELVNHWQPLLRYLRGRYNQLIGSVSPWNPLPWDGANVSDQTPIDREDRLRWLSARVALAETPETRFGFELARAELLYELGDSYLAEQQLRGLLLYSPELRMRDRAASKLLEIYRSQGNIGRQGVLLAARCVQDPTPKAINACVRHLAEMGQEEFSLQLSLALPEEARDSATLMACAMPLRWWSTFEKAREGLPDEKTKALWKGHRSWMEGRQLPALRQYADAGLQGHQIANYLRKTWTVRRDLLAGNDEEKQGALTTWAALESRLPGFRNWQRDEGLIKDFDRGITVEAVETNAFYRTFASSQEKPVTLCFLGPIEIELECRPLHEGGPESDEGLDGWINIQEAGKRRLLHLLPVLANKPTSGLAATGRSELKFGRKVTKRLTFGPGVHHVTIDSETFDVAVSVLSARPSSRLSYLPPISSESILAFTQPIDQQRTRLSQRSIALEYISPEDSHDSQLTAVHDYHSNQESSSDASGRVRLANHTSALRNNMAIAFASLSPSEKVARFLAEDRLNDALDLSWNPNNSEQRTQRAYLYKWIAERSPERAPSMLVQLSELLEAYPSDASLRAMHGRLSKEFRWERVRHVESCGGTRDVNVRGWEPEVASLLRRSLLTGSTLAQDHIATVGEELSIVMTLPDPAEIHVETRLLDMPYLLTTPVITHLTGPDGTEHVLSLRAGEVVKTPFVLSPGKHTFQASMENAVANQFLAIRLVEYDSEHEPAEREQSRSWFVGTEEEPVRFALTGPTWLRIDSRSSDGTTTRYQAIHEALKIMTLSPMDGSDEALFRVHRMVHRPNEISSAPPARSTTIVPHPAPKPVATMPVNDHTGLVARFDDQYALGWQENGTPSLTLRAVNRRSTDENTETLTDAETFLEFGATYRKYHPQWRTYAQWRHFNRWRETGGPTVGYENRFDWFPDDRPYRLFAESRVLLQDPDGEHLLDGGSREWAISGRVGLSVARKLSPQFYHVAGISVFGRDQSIKKRSEYETNKVDQDLFTPYKRAHRYGVQASETLHWKPWQDTDLYIGASVGSNEDFNIFQPDHTKAWIGWRQQLGNWQSDLRFRNTNYFADDDRRKSSTRHALSLALTGEHWLKNQTRLEYGGKLTHHFEDNAQAFSVFLTWHFGEGRAFRDFRPGEIPFRDLRERQIPTETNNHLWLDHAVPPTK